MGLLDQILGAIDNPNQQASTGQLAQIMNTVEQLSGNYGTDPSQMNSAFSIVGNFVRSALQQKQAVQGQGEAQAIVNQYSGSYPNPQAVNSLFSSQQINSIVDAVAQRTGLNAGMVQQMLPILVPLVLNFLKTGTQTNNTQAGNPVLNAFLDADRDGDVDIVDAMQLAARHFNR